ncbi:MAG: dihydrolipoyl dehydrogenase, partial [Bacteroidales bacterium]|nr:dihydrolipoyl dehydrogenase [Bacteroidales bacterium]
NTVLFEKKDLGGVCLNEGCIPTKTLLYSAKIYDNAKDSSKYGIITNDVGFDFSKIMSRKNIVVKKLVSGVASKMKKHNVKVVSEFAVIGEKGNGSITIMAGGNSYPCKNLLICTGSEAFLPPIKGLEPDKVMTNREILNIEKVPGSLTIIGGGVIGMEFASFFSSMGSQVTVIEMLDEILTGMDKEMSVMLRKEFEKKGVKFHLQSKVTEIKGKEVIFENDGNTGRVTSEEILVSVGRKPNIQGFGLEKLGVELLKGGIKIDEKCRTNIPNVYAAGDVTGFSLLAHTASREAEVVINNLSGKRDNMRYKAIPAVVYTNPEISGVGLTEEKALEMGMEIQVKKLPMSYAGRFIAENEGKNGLCKIITDKRYGQILGVHMIGNPSSEIIYGAAMAVEMEMTLDEMEEIIFPHPTVSEIFRENTFAFKE